MNVTSDYFVVRGKSIDECVKSLSDAKHEDLVALIVNNRINEFVSRYSDYKEDDLERNEHGKRIPYIGWYWRSTDFVGKEIRIGDCGNFIGVMENNKWDYPERSLTEDECTQVINIIWEAKTLSEQGGLMSEIEKNTKDKINELWPLFQTFKIK